MRLFDLCVAKKLSGGGSQINPQDFVVIYERTSMETGAKCHQLSNPDHDLTWNELIALFLNKPVTFIVHSKAPGYGEFYRQYISGLTGDQEHPYSWDVETTHGTIQTLLSHADLDSAAEVIL